MGFGCSAAGVTGCRIIDSKRERLVAILTNCLVPCNGKFPTLAAMIAVGMVMTGRESSFIGAVALTGCILLGIFMTFLVSRILSGTLLKGVPSAFTLELPPYRRPQFSKVIVRSFLDRTLFVLGRAAVVAAPAGVLIWLFSKMMWEGTPIILKLAEILNPVGQIFGMDGIILTAFLLGFPANEIVVPIMLMLYLSSEHLVEFQQIDQLSGILVGAGWTPVTIVCVCVFMLFHWPCSTTVLTTYKETGSLKWTIAGFFIPTAVGLILCAAIHFISGFIF